MPPEIQSCMRFGITRLPLQLSQQRKSLPRLSFELITGSGELPQPTKTTRHRQHLWMLLMSQYRQFSSFSTRLPHVEQSEVVWEVVLEVLMISEWQRNVINLSRFTSKSPNLALQAFSCRWEPQCCECNRRNNEVCVFFHRSPVTDRFHIQSSFHKDNIYWQTSTSGHNS